MATALPAMLLHEGMAQGQHVQLMWWAQQAHLPVCVLPTLAYREGGSAHASGAAQGPHLNHMLVSAPVCCRLL
jgi:hypothetical protein